MKAHPRRGDVFWVKLDPAHGTEIRKTRPAVVISNDSCNIYGTRVIVLPVTSNISSLFPGEAMIDIQGRPARALGDQMRSLVKTDVEIRQCNERLCVNGEIMDEFHPGLFFAESGESLDFTRTPPRWKNVSLEKIR